MTPVAHAASVSVPTPIPNTSTNATTGSAKTVLRRISRQKHPSVQHVERYQSSEATNPREAPWRAAVEDTGFISPTTFQMGFRV